MEDSGYLIGIILRLNCSPHCFIRKGTLNALTVEKFCHIHAGPTPTLAIGDAVSVKMIGNGLGCNHTRHRGGFNFNNEVTKECLVLLLFCHSVLQYKIVATSVWKSDFDRLNI